MSRFKSQVFCGREELLWTSTFSLSRSFKCTKTFKRHKGKGNRWKSICFNRAILEAIKDPSAVVITYTSAPMVTNNIHHREGAIHDWGSLVLLLPFGSRKAATCCVVVEPQYCSTYYQSIQLLSINPCSLLPFFALKSKIISIVSKDIVGKNLHGTCKWILTGLNIQSKNTEESSAKCIESIKSKTMGISG